MGILKGGMGGWLRKVKEKEGVVWCGGWDGRVGEGLMDGRIALGYFGMGEVGELGFGCLGWDYVDFGRVDVMVRLGF